MYEKPRFLRGGSPKNSPTGTCSRTRPFAMNTTSSASRVACPRLCVVITILQPSVRISRMIRSTISAPDGSRLAVGSSSSSRRGLVSQARASARRCRSPPESCRALSFARSARPTRSSIAQALACRSARPTPSGIRPSAAFSITAARSMIGCWNTIATPAGQSCCTPQRSCPPDGTSRPQRILSNTLLPAPFGPSTTEMPSPPRVRSSPCRTAWPLGTKRRSEAEMGNMDISRSAAWPSYEQRKPGR